MEIITIHHFKNTTTISTHTKNYFISFEKGRKREEELIKNYTHFETKREAKTKFQKNDYKQNPIKQVLNLFKLIFVML